MNQFRTAFFGGYRKEQVDEYVNSMITQLEQMKESFLTKEEEENRLREELAVMKKRMEGLENQQNTRIEELENQLKAGRTELEKKTKHQAELEEKLKNQQDDYESASRILQMAEREAKIIEDEAQQKAVSYYRKAEADIIARNEAAKNELSAARYQILQYLESLNSTRNKLADTYAELGCLVKRMPSRMEDLIPAISFEGQTGAGEVIGTGEAAERGRVLDLLKREGYQSEHISRQIPKSPTLKSQTDESRYAL